MSDKNDQLQKAELDDKELDRIQGGSTREVPESKHKLDPGIKEEECGDGRKWAGRC